jgi:nitrite reductase (NADH) small subunit
MTTWIDIGALTEIPVLGSRIVRKSGLVIAVFRTAGDALYAVEDRCPHKGGPLSQGIVHGCKVTCPLHSQIIDLSSGEVCAPDEGRVRAFPVRLVEGRIELQIEPGDDSSRQLLDVSHV